MRRMMEVVDYRVMGRGPFPVDMLRYDECWPTSELNADLLRDAIKAEPGDRTTFEIHLRTHRAGGPSDRWDSFNWKLILGNN